MTTKNSICIKCEHLDAITSARCTSSEETPFLISSCIYGGKGAGNRKTCKKFQLADKIKISKRLAALGEGAQE